MIDARLGCFDPKARIFFALTSLVHFHASDSDRVLCLVADASGVEFTRHPCQLNDNALIPIYGLDPSMSLFNTISSLKIQADPPCLAVYANTCSSRQKWARYNRESRHHG